MWNATQHNLHHIYNHGMNIKTRVIQSNSLSFDIKNDNTSSVRIKHSCLFKTTRPKQAYPYKIIQFGHASFSSHKNAPMMHNLDDKPSNWFILLVFSNFFNLHAIHEREPWTQHYGGREYGGCGEDKNREIVSHQLGISTGYGDAH